MSHPTTISSTAPECLTFKYSWTIGDLRRSWDTHKRTGKPIGSESYTIFPHCKHRDCYFRMGLLKNTTDDECILRLYLSGILVDHLVYNHDALNLHYSVYILGSDGIKSVCDKDITDRDWDSKEHNFPIKIAKEDLQNGSGILNKGCLEIRVEFTVTRFVQSSTEQPRRGISQAGNLTSDMKDLLETGKLADFEIKTKDRTFKVHKLVLGLRSPVFRAMLEADMKESREKSLNLEHIETNIVELFLRFIYLDKLDAEMTHEATVELLKLADTYQLEYLKTICASELADNLSIGNVIDLLELAERHNLELLGIAAGEFIRINRRSLTGLQSDLVKLVSDFPELGRKVMSLLMS